jgi:hypothetical protein
MAFVERAAWASGTLMGGGSVAVLVGGVVVVGAVVVVGSVVVGVGMVVAVPMATADVWDAVDSTSVGGVLLALLAGFFVVWVTSDRAEAATGMNRGAAHSESALNQTTDCGGKSHSLAEDIIRRLFHKRGGFTDQCSDSDHISTACWLPDERSDGTQRFS